MTEPRSSGPCIGLVTPGEGGTWEVAGWNGGAIAASLSCVSDVRPCVKAFGIWHLACVPAQACHCPPGRLLQAALSLLHAGQHASALFSTFAPEEDGEGMVSAAARHSL